MGREWYVKGKRVKVRGWTSKMVFLKCKGPTRLEGEPLIENILLIFFSVGNFSHIVPSHSYILVSKMKNIPYERSTNRKSCSIRKCKPIITWFSCLSFFFLNFIVLLYIRLLPIIIIIIFIFISLRIISLIKRSLYTLFLIFIIYIKVKTRSKK